MRRPMENSTGSRTEYTMQTEYGCGCVPRSIRIGTPSVKIRLMMTEGKWAKMHDISRRVYDPEGIAPTIHTMGGGNTEIKILEREQQKGTEMKTKTFNKIFYRIAREISAGWCLQTANGKTDEAFVECFGNYLDIKKVIDLLEKYEAMETSDLDYLRIMLSDYYAQAMFGLAELKMEEAKND